MFGLKDLVDEDKLVRGLAELVVPALAQAAKEVVRETMAGLVGLTVTVGRKAEAPKE